MAFDFKTIRSWLSDYAGQLKKLRADIEKLEIEREDVLFAPLVQADVRAALVKWVADQGGMYQDTLKKNLSSLVSNRQTIEDASLFSQFMHYTPIMRTGNGSNGLSNNENDRALAGLFGDTLIKSIDATLSQMEWPKEGMSGADRTRKLAELDKKLEALRAEEKSFVAAAADTGMNVEAIE